MPSTRIELDPVSALICFLKLRFSVPSKIMAVQAVPGRVPLLGRLGGGPLSDKKVCHLFFQDRQILRDVLRPIQGVNDQPPVLQLGA